MPLPKSIPLSFEIVTMRLILARHGQTEVNRLGNIQGVGPTPLNETGRMQAVRLAHALRPEAPFVLYSSPLHRALETARAVAEQMGAKIVSDDGLTEMDVGEFEGLSGPQLRERFPEVMRMWDEDAANAVMLGGESLADVRDRAWQTVKRLAERHPSDTVVAVTHNFTIQTIICTALGMPLNNFRRLRVDLASITRFDVSGDRITQLSVNETWHLK